MTAPLDDGITAGRVGQSPDDSPLTLVAEHHRGVERPDQSPECLRAIGAFRDDKISGKDVTPFLLGYFHEHTHGVSLQANIDLVLNNATLAAKIAVSLAAADQVT